MQLAGLALVAVLTAASLAAAQNVPAPAHAASGEYNQALGVDCEHCHESGNFAATTKPTFDFARRMSRMVAGLNAGPLKTIGAITCWSCHRGSRIPARLPRAAWEPIAARYGSELAGGREGLALAMAVYSASLGVECVHCHTPGDWRNGSKAPHVTVATMSSMFDLVPTYFAGSERQPRTQCYMCHQGSTRIERRPQGH
jgi:Photosynthetic reaction centre cytochrome C subunit